MPTRDDWSRKAFVAVLMIGAVGLFGCRPSTKTAEADKSQASTTEAEATTTESAEEELAIPEGTADELFQFLQDVEARELGTQEQNAQQPVDIQQRTEAVGRLMRTRIRVCDKLLSQDGSAESRASATQMKLDALRTLAAIEPDPWADTFAKYCDELIGGDDPFLGALRGQRVTKDS